MSNLISQATNDSTRFKPVPHHILKPGDIVLLIEQHAKRCVYPLGKILSVETNTQGEVTAAKILKGSTGETVYRHVTSLIPLVTSKEGEVNEPNLGSTEGVSIEKETKSRPKRSAAEQAKNRLRNAFFT